MSYQAAAGAQAEGRPVRTSELLREFANSLTAERVSVAEIVAALGGRGIGILVAIFSLPNIISTPVLFGNVVLGILPLFFAIQLMLGFRRLMLPRFVAQRSVKAATLKALTPRVAAVLSWFERLLSPRLSSIAGPHTEQLFGILCVVLALAAILPIPFGHNLPALGLVLIGLGLIEQDGVAILIGGAIGIIGAIIDGAVVFGFAHGVHYVLRDLG